MRAPGLPIRPERCRHGRIKASLPAHLPEARQLVRIGGEFEVARGGVEGHEVVERHGVGLVNDDPVGLAIGGDALLRIGDGVAARPN